MNNFQIRTAVPDRDYEQLAALLSQIWSDPVNLEGLREWDTTEDGRIMNRKLGYESLPGEYRLKLIL